MRTALVLSSSSNEQTSKNTVTMMAKKRKPTSKPQQRPSSSTKQPKIVKPPTPPPSESEEEEFEEIEEEESDDNDGSSSSESEEEEEISESEGEEEEEEEEEEGEDSRKEAINELLQPFTKDQLINILKEAVSTNPSIATEIFNSVDADPIQRKIFVHGLGWDATNETLISVFEQYGQIEECKVVADKATGRSKGYGFLLFKSRSSARKALKEPQKKVGNRTVSCQYASLGSMQSQKQDDSSDFSVRKLYVANVGPQISVEKLRWFFAKFGEIEDGPTGFDKNTGKFRGFAFIIYKSLEGIKKALEEPVKVLDGVKLQCSLATKNRINNNSSKAVETPSLASGNNAGVMQGNLGIQGLLNQGIVGQSVNPASAVLLAQNPGLGVLNPILGLGVGGMLNQAGLNQSFAGGVSQPLSRVGNAVAPVGLGVGFTTQHGVNTVSPSVIGSYNSQAALQGLGAYQSSQLGEPSVSVARSQAGIGSVPSYFGR